jgi:phospholipase A1
MVGVALNHESNGKVILLAGNRIILHAGFERNNWTVYVLGFVMPAAIDDNPICRICSREM